MLNFMIENRAFKFNAEECDKYKAVEIQTLVPYLTSEELLTIKHLTNKTAIVRIVNREIFRRLEPGDYVEVIDGLEKIVRRTETRLYFDGRDHAYSVCQIAPYRFSRKHEDKCVYWLMGVNWDKYGIMSLSINA